MTGAVRFGIYTLSEIINGRKVSAARSGIGSAECAWAVPVLNHYTVLCDLKAKDASAQGKAFEQQCRVSAILPLSDEIVVRGADIFADLRKGGQIIGDADILIAATALVSSLVLVTNNLDHFRRVRDLRSESWKYPSLR